MFEEAKLEEKEKPRVVYVYKLIETLKNGEETTSFSWRADVSSYHVLEDQENKIVNIDFNLINTSKDLKNLRDNFDYHKKLIESDIEAIKKDRLGIARDKVSINKHELSFDIPEEIIKQIEKDLNKRGKKDIRNIKILPLTEEEISEFIEEKNMV